MPHNAWSQGIFAAAFPGLSSQKLPLPDYYRTNVYSITCDTPKLWQKSKKSQAARAFPDAESHMPGASISSDRTPAWARRAAMPLDEDVTRLAKGKNLATVVTLMPSGQPQAQLTWIDADDEHVLVNTEPQRQRSRNVARDPRITVLIHSDDPQDWAEVRGHVVETIDGDEARRHIDEVSRKYTGHDFTAPVGPHGRVILKIAADKVNTPRLLG